MNVFLTNVFDRRVARTVMCVIVAAALLLGGMRSLGERRTAALNVYANGQYAQGQGIPYDIDHCAAAYANMITVAKRYMDADDTRISRLSAALETLGEAVAPDEAFAANEACNQAFLPLYDDLGGLPLSLEDARYRDQLYDNVKSARHRLSLSPYNAAANDYNDARRGFPGILYATVFFMPPLELYR